MWSYIGATIDTSNMPFGSLLQCFKKTAVDLAEDYAGEAAGDIVEDVIDQGTIDADSLRASTYFANLFLFYFSNSCYQSK